MSDSTNDWLDEILTPTFYKVYMNGFTDQLARHEHGTGHAKSVTDQWIDEAMQAIEAHIKQLEVEARIDELQRTIPLRYAPKANALAYMEFRLGRLQAQAHKEK